MLIEDIIGTNVNLGSRELATIKTECSQFLKESAGLPLLKPLPLAYNTLHRVKVRLHKRTDTLGEVFNRAFEERFNKLRQRAIFTYASAPQLTEDQETYYVFPTNGYKYLYSKEVTNSSADYKKVIDTLSESFDDSATASDIVTDLLKFTYTSDKLYEGIAASAEVILYGIPYYYAVKVSATNGYTQLLDQLQ